MNLINEWKDISLILKSKDEYKNKILSQYSSELSSIDELLGDNETDMSSLFYLINRHFLYMLSNDPDISIREKDIKFRKKFYKILKTVGPSMLGCTQVIENREEFADGQDETIYVAQNDKPVIFVANHGFRDDALATVLAAGKPAYIYWGSLPLFYNSIDGLASSLVGEVVMNRKKKESRIASIEKSIRVLQYGTDLIIFPEGGWNKTSEKLVLDLWRGVYKISVSGEYNVVPITHYVRDPEIIDKKNIIHTIIDKPIPLYQYNQEDALIRLRDILATWQYKMMGKYGLSTRKEEMKNLENSDEKWNSLISERMRSVARYDSTVEKCSDFRPANIIRPEEAFRNIANIKNVNENNFNMIQEAKKIVETREYADFQRRF